MKKSLREFLLEFYPPQDFPCIYQQWQDWARDKPLAGKRILDATPLFRNTLAKHEALLSAGADLVIGLHPLIPYDHGILAMLPEFGLKATTDPEGDFDVVLDCGGCFAHLRPVHGVCELTRTGWQAYKDANLPVFFADGGKLKALETSLGTGDGFSRAMTQLCGVQDWKGKHCVLFGYGKVGYGIALSVLRAGASLTVIDLSECVARIPEGVSFISNTDRSGIEAALMDCFVAVTAMGQARVLDQLCSAELVSDSSAYFVNMGLEDEWGDSFAQERILNKKAPLNFILKDPTRMNYIEAVMALHNAGAVALCEAKYPAGILLPPADLEESLLQTILRDGCISQEIQEIFPQ